MFKIILFIFILSISAILATSCQIPGCDVGSPDACTQCAPGLTLSHDNQCISNSKCPPHKYEKENKCHACNHLCASCYGPGNHQCLSCKPGNTTTIFRDKNTCSTVPKGAELEACGVGRGLGPDNICTNCPDGCTSCRADFEQKMQCLSCKDKSAFVVNDQSTSPSASHWFEESCGDKGKGTISTEKLMLAFGSFAAGAFEIIFVHYLIKCLRFVGIMKKKSPTSQR